MKDKVKILFICHGNICRSPMAEFVFKDMVKKAGLEWKFEIASAATSTDELGCPVHRGTREKLRQVGISCAGKTARQMTKRDYAEYDLLIGMDRYNIRNMTRIAGGDPDGKISLLMDWAGEPGRDIDDPWYTRDFTGVLKQIEEGCRGLLEKTKDA